jgi:hypothetical protein
MQALQNLISGITLSRQQQTDAFDNRIYEILVRIKEDLGIDDLLLAIADARSIASQRVDQYLERYQERVIQAVVGADDAASLYYTQNLRADQALGGIGAAVRSAKNIQKLLAMKWKANYEVEMEDVNASMPLAQQIVSKYMSNFAAKAQ